MKLNLVMLGPPGAGKGTQASHLTRLWGIPHISTGAILRDAIRTATPLGREVEAITASGRLVDDTLVTRIVAERLARPDAAEGFLLDGYPRTLAQAQALDSLVARHGPLIVLEIALADSDVMRRLAARMVCSECGANALDDDDACHDCGGKRVPRPDDKEEVVRKRLDVYRRETEPAVEYYRHRETYRRVNGAQLFDDVASDIVRAIKEVTGANVSEPG